MCTHPCKQAVTVHAVAPLQAARAHGRFVLIYMCRGRQAGGASQLGVATKGDKEREFASAYMHATAGWSPLCAHTSAGSLHQSMSATEPYRNWPSQSLACAGMQATAGQHPGPRTPARSRRHSRRSPQMYSTLMSGAASPLGSSSTRGPAAPGPPPPGPSAWGGGVAKEGKQGMSGISQHRQQLHPTSGIPKDNVGEPCTWGASTGGAAAPPPLGFHPAPLRPRAAPRRSRLPAGCAAGPGVNPGLTRAAPCLCRCFAVPASAGTAAAAAGGVARRPVQVVVVEVGEVAADAGACLLVPDLGQGVGLHMAGVGEQGARGAAGRGRERERERARVC